MDDRTELRGPWFDGRAAEAIDGYRDWAQETLARETDNAVHERLHEVLRHPTGHYESTVTAEPAGTSWEVTGERVVYGWWLEGVGSRNSPVTRFPGYHTFLTVAREIQDRAVSVVDPIPGAFLREMGGER